MNAVRERAVAALAKGDASGLTPDDLKADLISDRKARHAVARYYSELAFLQGQIEFWGSFVAPCQMVRHAGIILSYDLHEPLRERAGIDFKLLAVNRAYVQESIDLLGAQLKFQNYRAGLLAAAEEMCRDLAEAAGKTCAAEPAKPDKTR